jgi:hypothetical protein
LDFPSMVPDSLYILENTSIVRLAAVGVVDAE